MKNYLLFFTLMAASCAYNASDYVATDPGSYYAGGDGLSFEQAVYFPGIKSSKQAKPLKQQWLAEKYLGYKQESQGAVIHDSKFYDRIRITTADGENKTIYFDLTPYLGRASNK